MFRRALTVLGEIVSLNDEHDKSVELFMPVDDFEKMSWISLCKHLSVSV